MTRNTSSEESLVDSRRESTPDLVRLEAENDIIVRTNFDDN